MSVLRRWSVLLCAIALALPAALLLDPEPDHGAAAAKSCPPYDFVGARGSGQPNLSSERGMGPEIHDLFLALRGWVDSGALSSYGVDYPAVGVTDGTSLINGAGALLHVGFLGEYTDSVREGQRDVEDHIRDRHSICPDTKFILAGYSQGAQATGDALEKMKGLRDLVVAAAFFGDPYFNPNSWSTRGNPDPSSYGLLGVRGEWPEELHGRVFSYCHYHDVICNISEKKLGGIYVRNYSELGLRKQAHVTPAYRMASQGGRGDADKAARDLARVLGVALPADNYTGPLDIAFAIDSTGSMFDEIDQVKINIADLVGQIARLNSTFRVALVDYKDIPGEESAYQARVDVPFTTDVVAFDKSLHALEAEGGGDEAESVYSGLMTALGLDWQTGARKLVIALGDAPAKDPEPLTGYTLRTVQQKALAVDPATIDTIQSGDDAETAASFSAIASATGGSYLGLSEESLSGLVPSIVENVRRTTMAPTAALQVPARAIIGQRLTLSAAASGDSGEPIAAFEWDLTGDGVFDLTSADRVIQFVYPTPFSGIVVLRARTASGLTSTTTAPIAVGAGPARAPRRPRILRGPSPPSKVTLRWRAGRGGPAAWFTIYAERGKVLTRLAPADIRHRGKGAKRTYELTVRGLSRNRTYRFWVSAGNGKGESRKAGPVRKPIRKRPQRRKRK